MIITSPLDSASWKLTTSNVLYITGAVFTTLTAAWVVYETRSVALGRQAKFFLLSEILGAISAAICLFGSIGAIHYGGVITHLKDVDLATYEKRADADIARNKKQAADAIKSAADDNLENTKLRLELTQHESNEKKTEAELAKQNKETSDFAQSLAQQQATMNEQAKVSPVLSSEQIAQLANALRPFRGADVILHSTTDTTVLRLEQTIHIALQKAGLTVTANSMDIGALYQGVTVVVHDPKDVPPLANALVLSLHAAGINIQTASLPERVPAGKVAIFMGPD
jgi:hypothetical protein